MKLKPSELNIPDENPFAEDVLKRQDSAENLTLLLSTVNEPFVLAIDSPWGTGKTTFITMWLKYLKNNSYPCIYFNAWENDFSDDPLVALIGELGAGLKTLKLDTTGMQKAKKHFNQTKEYATAIVKSAGSLGIKLGTAGIVDIEDITNKLPKEKIDKYEEDKKTIKDFKKHLGELASSLSTADEKPLILFIDELDRCRPLYSIELLEKAKHFFNVENIIFVLAIDKEQLGHSIMSIYGVGMNVDGYLKRFIDLDYHLPEPEIETFCRAQYKRFGLEEYLSERRKTSSEQERETLEKFLEELFKLFGYGLRDIEHCFTRIGLVFRMTTQDDKIFSVMLAILIVIKEKNPSLYNKIKLGGSSEKEVFTYIKDQPGGTELLKSNHGIAIEANLAYGFCRGDRLLVNNLYDKYENLIRKNPHNKTESSRAEDIYYYIKSLARGFIDILDYVVRKLEVADSFKL